MWTVRFFPIWNLAKLEEWLINMEGKGLRLDRFSLSLFFHFTASKPKTVNYVVLYSFIKEWGMIDVAMRLKSQHSAIPVGNPFGCVSIYRICDLSFCLHSIEKTRLHYIQHVILQKLLISTLIGLPVQICIVLNILLEQRERLVYFIEIIFFSICAIPYVYYCIGLIWTAFSLRMARKHTRGQGDGSVVPLSLTKSQDSHTTKWGDKDAKTSEKEKQ